MGRTSTRQWVQVVKIVRQYVIDTGAPCALCMGSRGPIDPRTQSEANRDADLSGQWWLLGANRPLALAVDHIVPHAAGGADTLENAQPSHKICNEIAAAKGHPKRGSKKTNARPVNGYWIALNGKGKPLNGRAIAGTRTTTHQFIAN